MKTKIYILTMLAIIIQVVVKSQTPANQAFQRTADFVLGYAYFSDEERKEFSGIEDPAELLIRAEELMKESEKTAREAAKLNAEEKEKALRTAEELIKKAEVRKLAACELTAYNNRAEFSMLKASFVNSLKGFQQDNSIVKRSKQDFFTAVQTYKIAKELREEAYAQRDIPAMLANLYNAEEKESAAFTKLVEATRLLENVSPQLLATK